MNSSSLDGFGPCGSNSGSLDELGFNAWAVISGGQVLQRFPTRGLAHEYAEKRAGESAGYFQDALAKHVYAPGTTGDKFLVVEIHETIQMRAVVSFQTVGA